MNKVPSVAPPPSEEEKARLEASKRVMNYLLLGLGGMVAAVLVFGVIKMVGLILSNG